MLFSHFNSQPDMVINQSIKYQFFHSGIFVPIYWILTNLTDVIPGIVGFQGCLAIY